MAEERPVIAVAAAAVCAGGVCYLGYMLVERVFGRVLKITVPATTANLACGFDAFGAAFELRMSMRVEPSKKLEFAYVGEGADQVARDESNLIWQSALACMRVYAPGKSLPPLKISISNPVPFGRGLGSSATAIIAGLGPSLSPLLPPKLFLVRGTKIPGKPCPWHAHCTCRRTLSSLPRTLRDALLCGDLPRLGLHRRCRPAIPPSPSQVCRPFSPLHAVFFAQ